MNDGFVPITAIFTAVFHPTEGTKVAHQVPEGTLTGASALFDFDTVKNLIIPKPPLCNRLVAFKINEYRVIGYPVTISARRYLRNSFSFNFCFVLPYSSDTVPFEPAVARLGRMFRALEEQLALLSRLDKVFYTPEFQASSGDTQATSLEHTPGHGRIQRVLLSLIELLLLQIYQDLNNYLECCIPIDLANSVDIKLFPSLPAPALLQPHQVPMLTVRLSLLVDVAWDPTMVRLLPYINGINSVRKISVLAGAEYTLVAQCIQHLMHYQCIVLVDVFQFSAIYAPTNRVGDFLTVPEMAEDCQAYVITQADVPPLSRTQDYFKELKIPAKATLFYLYRLLNQGQTIKEWWIQHQKMLRNIDVRRFINFGVVRGILYRVHLYPVLHLATKAIETDNDVARGFESVLAYHQKRAQKSHSARSSATEQTLLKDVVMESNLTTSKKSRTVSFNYRVSRDRRSQGTHEPFLESDHSDHYDLDVFDSELDSENDAEDDAGPRASADKHKQKHLLRRVDTADEPSAAKSSESKDIVELIGLLQQSCSYDRICTDLQKPRAQVEKLMDKLGPHSVINS